MRPSRTVARAALTAALALGALPGLVGSHEPSTARPIDVAAFRLVNLATTPDRQSTGQILPDAAGRSDGALDATDAFADPMATAAGSPDGRAQPNVQGARASSSWKRPKSTMTGYASFYDNGTTAMRLPRGTTVVICGGGGCIERAITDYGPTKAGGRIVDLYRPDFFSICGCGWWSGTTEVTIRVY
jgi:hypothetical protein